MSRQSENPILLVSNYDLLNNELITARIIVEIVATNTNTSFIIKVFRTDKIWQRTIIYDYPLVMKIFHISKQDYRQYIYRYKMPGCAHPYFNVFLIIIIQLYLVFLLQIVLIYIYYIQLIISEIQTKSEFNLKASKEVDIFSSVTYHNHIQKG